MFYCFFLSCYFLYGMNVIFIFTNEHLIFMLFLYMYTYLFVTFPFNPDFTVNKTCTKYSIEVALFIIPSFNPNKKWCAHCKSLAAGGRIEHPRILDYLGVMIGIWASLELNFATLAIFYPILSFIMDKYGFFVFFHNPRLRSWKLIQYTPAADTSTLWIQIQHIMWAMKCRKLLISVIYCTLWFQPILFYFKYFHICCH